MKSKNYFIIITFLIIGVIWPIMGQTVSLSAQYLENTRARTSPEILANNILITLPAGSLVHILGENDLWYQVELQTGQVAWSMKKYLKILDNESLNVPAINNISLLSRVTGRLLLQVQQQGQIWYIDVPSQKRYLVTKEDALPLFRALSLGINNSDLNKIFQCDGQIKVATDLANRLAGRLLLAVEDLGRVWYVYPDQHCRYEVRVDNIMELFRSLSLGITDNDLAQIPINDLHKNSMDDIKSTISTEQKDYNLTETPNLAINSHLDILSDKQATNINLPSGLNLVEVEAYSLQKINTLRVEKGLRILINNKYLRNTAQEWAIYMGRDLGYCTHDRPDASSMHKWIDQKNIPWTERYSLNGWKSNYFTENIAYAYTNGSLESVKKVIDSTLAWMLAEANDNGPHYRTIYHPDWNAVGMGFYFQKFNENNYKIYIVWHYGSVDLEK